jgi:hypothetical protein
MPLGASCLALVACTGGASDASVPDAKAPHDSPVTVLMDRIPCVDDVPQLASGLTLNQEFDYVADRLGVEVLSSVGELCASAEDVPLCRGAAERNALGSFRHLLTTRGNTVQQWDGGVARAILMPIDGIAEVAWIASAFDYFVGCDAEVTEDGDLYILRNVEARYGCANAQAYVTVVVNQAGGVYEVETMSTNTGVCEAAAGTGIAGAIPMALPPPPVPAI